MIQFKKWDIDDQFEINALNEWIRQTGAEIVDYKMINEYQVLISYREEVVQDETGRFIEGFTPINPAWENLIKGE